MYRPVQIPQILDPSFSQNIAYSEDYDQKLSDFAICLWQMQPKGDSKVYAGNVIVTDGCIDLVVDFDKGEAGFSGMSETEYDYQIEASKHFMGIRFKPGAFAQLTGLPASHAMDKFLPLKDFDSAFDGEAFFSSSFENAKELLKDYVAQLISVQRPNEFVELFDTLSESVPLSVLALCERLHLSPRQCQRLFMKNYGYSPQKALAILRFQYCLKVLTSKEAKPSDLLSIVNYCDQSHCIKDFKKNIGLTPLELIEKYQ